jgi:hypothetical protein
VTVATLLCALLLAASCTVPVTDQDRSDQLLAASEQQGASSRPLNYPPAEVPR